MCAQASASYNPVMVYGVLADGVVLLHVGFVAFVVLGGLLVPRWPRIA